MAVNLKAIAKQVGKIIAGTNGQDVELASSLIGELYTTGQWGALLKGGFLYSVTVGGLTAGGDVSRVTGGGSGTTIDQDQPELIIGVDSGYSIAPVEADVSVYVALVGGGQGQTANIYIMGDNSVGVPTSVTGTTETPTNLLDGGPNFPGRAYSAITADITDPGVEILLGSRTVTYQKVGTDVGPAIFDLNLSKQWRTPHWIAGAGSIYVCYGSDVAVSGTINLIVACVPSSFVPSS